MRARSKERFGPRVVDVPMIALVTSTIGVGTTLLAWHARALDLIAGGHYFYWLSIVTFGVVWMAGSDVMRRTTCGVFFGAVIGLASSLSGRALFPGDRLALALWIGSVLGCAAVISHVAPRALSLGSTTVGFGLGAGVASIGRSNAWTDVAITTLIGIALGALFAHLLHALVVAAGRKPPKQGGFLRHLLRARVAAGRRPS